MDSPEARHTAFVLAVDKLARFMDSRAEVAKRLGISPDTLKAYCASRSSARAREVTPAVIERAREALASFGIPWPVAA